MQEWKVGAACIPGVAHITKSKNLIREPNMSEQSEMEGLFFGAKLGYQSLFLQVVFQEMTSVWLVFTTQQLQGFDPSNAEAYSEALDEAWEEQDESPDVIPPVNLEQEPVTKIFL